MMRLGIVGTAGRRDDASLVSLALQNRMLDAGRSTVKALNITSLVSGGAAWADHVVVQLVLEGVIPACDLTLHFPSPINKKGFNDSSSGKTMNHYHNLFKHKTNINSIEEILEVISLGAKVFINKGGFKARNSDVARDSDALLAFTFGSGEPWKAKIKGNMNAMDAGLKPGGTYDTWNKCHSDKKIHVCLSEIKQTLDLKL